MKFNGKNPLDWLVLLLAVFGSGLAISRAQAQNVFNCGPGGTAWVAASGIGNTGTCYTIFGAGSAFAYARGTTNGSTPYLDSPWVNIAPLGSTHTGMSFAYMGNTGSNPTTVNVQAFTEVVTFVPNGQYISLVWDNSNPGLPAGASAEGGFYQGECGSTCSTYSYPNKTIALMFDQYNPLTQSAGSFTYSSVQLYDAESLQPPFLPVSSNSGNYTYYPTNKISTSPVALNSPATSAGTSTQHTYSATVTYDGSNFSLCLYDVTAANGSCSSGTSGTGTYFQHTWTNVLIPTIVGGTSGSLEIIESTGESSAYDLLVGNWSYTINTPTGTPSYTAWNAGSTYNNGTVSVASPVYSEAPGTYTGTQSVSLTTSTTPNSYICYALSASPPALYPWPDQAGGCVNGTLYTGPVSIASSTTLYAVAGSNIVAFGPANTSPTGAGPMSTLVAGTYTITPACGTPITTGMTTSQIQAAINSCSAGGTAEFPAGTFSVNATLSIPCGVSVAGPALTPSTSGPVVYTPSATVNWSGANSSPEFSYGPNCSAAASFENLECNMNHPSPDGGQCLYVGSNVSNYTVKYDYAHGNQGGTASTNTYDGLIYFDGNSSATPDSNIVVTWNRLGATGDCSNIMSNITYPGFGGNGGFCNGTGVHTGMNGFTFENNDTYYQEEGLKVFESQGKCLNCVIEYNDWSNIHRISFETQANLYPGSTTNMQVRYNSIHDPFFPEAGTFGLSVANGCSNNNPSSSGCVTNTDYNVLMANTALATPCSANCYYGDGIEQWGSTGTTANYNLVQGEWSNSMMLAQDGAFSDSNNHIQSSFGAGGNNTPADCYPGYAGAFGWWGVEDGPANTPSGSGNQCDFFNGSTQTSIAPTISPASGSFTTSQTVTFTNSGTNRDTNTGIWYTTDGSTPVPGSGTARYIASGGTIAVSTTTTVKAVGMWGAQNQPSSYASGYGYGPSAVVSATYTAGSPPTLNSVSLTAAGPVTSIQVGTSVQINAACHYANGTTTGCNTPDAYGNSVSNWNTSNAGIVSLNSSGLAGGVAVGSANLTATVAGVTSPPFTLSVTAASVTLSSVSLATTGGITTLVVGGTNQLVATCHYSDSSTTSCATTDSHGNKVTAWTSTATTIATVSSSGLVSGVAAGSTNLTAVVAGITSSPALTITVTAAPPTLTGGYLGTPGSANTMVVGGTLQFSAYCNYSNSTTTNCSVADIYGNAVTSWTSSNTGSVTIGAVGSANPGLASAVAAGTPYIKAYVGTVGLNQWDLTVSAPTVTLTGVSLATTGGVTGLFVGSTNQLIATCSYSDSSTTNCTTTDSHGNVAGTYASSSTGHATVNATTGLVTGVAAGTTNLTAHAGTFTSPNLPLTVVAVPSGVYQITISGPVSFSGTVKF
jgi:hypothetical protein